MEWRIDECVVIGGSRGLESKAAFSRALPVLRRNGSEMPLFKVTSYPSPKVARGVCIEREEWQILLGANDAFELETTFGARSSAAFYLFRKNSDGIRDKALSELTESATRFEAVTMKGVIICYVDEPRSDRLRISWRDEAYNQGCEDLRHARLNQALEMAELAFVLSRGLRNRIIALLALVHERRGEQNEADSYLAVMRNNKGEELYRETLEHMEILRTTLPDIPLCSHPRSRPRYTREADLLISRGFQQFGAAA